MSSREMAGMPPLEQAKTAIRHVLHAIRNDPYKSYLMGLGNGSFQKLTEAASTLFERPLEEVRMESLHPRPQSPVTGEKAEKPVVEVMTDDDLIQYLAESASGDRLQLLGELRDRFCLRCGGDQKFGARNCGCGIGRAARAKGRQVAA